MNHETSRPARSLSEPPQTLIAVAVALGYYLVAGVTVALFTVTAFFLRGVPGVAIWFGWTAPVVIAVAAGLMIVCLVYLFVIVWAALPRWSPARIDGVRVSRSDQPALWELIDDVAQRAGRRSPRQVRLTLRYELTSADAGGPFGWLKAPILRIGVPLLHLHTEAEVRALLAHELGHLANGDRSPMIRLILRIREPLRRTTGLSRNPAVGLVLLPLSLVHLYASFAIRVLNGLVWSQDFAADRAALRSEPAEALAGAVHFAGECSAVWTGFRDTVLWPMVELKYQVPILAGLDRYLESSRSIEAAEQLANETRSLQPNLEIVDAAPDRWRSRLLLDSQAERDPDSPVGSRRLSGMVELETALLRAHFPFGPTLLPVGWSQVVEVVYLPLWRNGCQANSALLAKHTPYTVAEATRKILSTASDIVIPNESQPWLRDPVPFTRWLLGAATCLAAYRVGCLVTAWPGEPIRISRNGSVLEPFDGLHDLEQGAITREEWWRRCAAVGILDTSLWPGAGSAGGVPSAA